MNQLIYLNYELLQQSRVEFDLFIKDYYERYINELLSFKEGVLKNIISVLKTDQKQDVVDWARKHRLQLIISASELGVPNIDKELIYIDGVCYGGFVTTFKDCKFTCSFYPANSPKLK